MFPKRIVMFLWVAEVTAEVILTGGMGVTRLRRQGDKMSMSGKGGNSKTSGQRASGGQADGMGLEAGLKTRPPVVTWEEEIREEARELSGKSQQIRG